MKITVAMLMENLDHYDIDYVKRHMKRSAAIDNANVLRKGQRDFNQNTMYIARSSALAALEKDAWPYHVFCIQDIPIKPRIIPEYVNNFIVVSDNVDEVDVLNDITTAFSRFNMYSEKMFKILTRGQSIQDIVDIGYEIVQNPILITDTSEKVVAYTPREATDIPSWLAATVKKGYIWLTPEQRQENLGNEKRTDASRAPVLFDHKTMGCPMLISSLLVDNTRVGYLTIVASNRPITRATVDFSQSFSQILCLELRNSSLINYNNGLKYEYLIKELLDRKIKRGDLESRLGNLRWQPKNHLYALTVKTSDMLPSTANRLRIIHHIANFLSHSKGTVHDGNIVILIERNTDSFCEELEYEMLSDYLTKNNLCGGLSQCFSDIENLEKYYRQSLKAIEIGCQNGPVHSIVNYVELKVDHFIDLATEKEDILDFCHPSLFKLIEYDEKHRTTFLDSLHQYISFGKKPSKTAKSLDIHRSSLSYRINKIQEIMGVNLQDSETMFHLHLSFKLLEHKRLSKKYT